MKLVFFSLLLLTGIVTMVWLQSGGPATRTIALQLNTHALVKPDAVSKSGFALIELFTSEGCSSCPSADALLSEHIDSATTQHLPVYALEFHVDYWNALGWKDAFSSPDFTARQNDYAVQMHLPSVYTPQVVVNGTSELVGSDREKLDQNIEAALARPSNFRIEHASAVQNGRRIDVTCGIVREGSITSDLTGKVLNVAVIQSAVETHVERGENSGRLLKHRNVVLSFRKLTASERITSSIAFPSQPMPRYSEASPLAVVFYLQNATTLEVLAAESAVLK